MQGRLCVWEEKRTSVSSGTSQVGVSRPTQPPNVHASNVFDRRG